MNKDKFWELIQIAHQQSAGDMDRKCDSLKACLNGISSEDVITFSKLFDEEMVRSYSWPLWGAAYVINGGCSDDTFDDFRSSLISRGKKSFEKAISNPDSLANEKFDEEEWFFEGFQYAVTDAVEEIVGTELESRVLQPDEPSGEPWEEDQDELKERYPNLWLSFKHIWSPEEHDNVSKSKPWWKFW